LTLPAVNSFRADHAATEIIITTTTTTTTIIIIIIIRNQKICVVF